MNNTAKSSAKNIAIVCNSLAGVGRAVTLAEKISLELSTKQILYFLFQGNWPSDFNSFTDVWIVGGDGTLNYFINQYPDIKLPLVIFNGGTGNDVHWMLYGKKSFEEQFQIALISSPKPIDAGRCNERLFINGLGIGFEGAVAESLAGKKKKPGKTKQLIQEIELWQKKLAPQLPDIDPHDLNLILWSILKGKYGWNRRFLLRKNPGGGYVC